MYELKNEMSKQEVFDYVCNHLLTQNVRSICTIERVCKYRGDKGLKCAIGCLIKDDEYTPELELTPYNLLNRLLSSNLITAYNRLNPHRSLLLSLQEIHDCHLPYEWRQKLSRLANKENLKYNF